jgi:hypothetical protein
MSLARALNTSTFGACIETVKQLHAVTALPRHFADGTAFGLLALLMRSTYLQVDKLAQL